MTQKPTDQLLESLSAMVDDEASELELRRVLRSLDEGDSTLEHWHRYHLVGAALRKEASVDCSVNLLGGISAAINGEELVDRAGDNSSLSAPIVPIKSKWKIFAGQSMVAASIAATFVLSFNYLGTQDVSDVAAPQLANSALMPENGAHAVADSVPIGFNLPMPEARVVRGGNASASKPSINRPQPRRYTDDLGDLATQQILDQLLIEHARRSSVNGSLGIMPFARVSKMGETK